MPKGFGSREDYAVSAIRVNASGSHFHGQTQGCLPATVRRGGG